MNRKAEIFFDAITLLREDLVEEAQNYVFRKKRRGWRTFGSLAACAVLVVSLGMLAVLPRGCGAGSGSDMSMNTSGNSSPPAGQTAPDVNGDMPYGGSDMNGAAPPPAPEEPEAAPGDGLVRFSGRVVEIFEDELLVEPVSTLPDGPELVRIPTGGLENLPEFYLDGNVTIVCEAVVWEDGEAVAENVVILDLVEP